MKCFTCSNTKDFTPLFPKFCATKNYLCRSCGLVFTPQGMRTVASDFYKKDGYFEKSANIGYRKIFFSKSLFAKLAKERLLRMQRVFSDFDFSGKKVLDVGCGYGHLLYILKKKYGCEVLGIEPSAEAAKTGGRVFGISIKPVLLEEFSSPSRFDVVLCSHVLEMVDNPVLFLQNLKGLMKDNGVLYIEVPNILRPTGGFTLDNFFLAESLQTFSAYNLNKFLQNCGLGTLNYDDKDFLRVICAHGEKENLQVPKITATEILNFLENYQNSYGPTNYAKVGGGKLGYLLGLVYYKFRDLIDDQTTRPKN